MALWCHSRAREPERLQIRVLWEVPSWAAIHVCRLNRIELYFSRLARKLLKNLDEKRSRSASTRRLHNRV